MKWILPWGLTKEDEAREDMPIITEKLSVYGYSLDRFKNAPTKQVEKVTIDLLNLLEKQLADKEIPWVLAASNDSVLLQSIAQIVPITWALTKSESVFTTDTDFIFRTFVKDMDDTDPFGEDYSGQVLDDIKCAGLLWWKSIGERVAGTDKYTGRFIQILDYRVEWALPTIFTYRYSKPFGKIRAKALWGTIEEDFGESFSGAMSDYCSVRVYNAKKSVKRHEEFNI